MAGRLAESVGAVSDDEMGGESGETNGRDARGSEPRPIRAANGGGGKAFGSKCGGGGLPVGGASTLGARQARRSVSVLTTALAPNPRKTRHLERRVVVRYS